MATRTSPTVLRTLHTFSTGHVWAVYKRASDNETRQGLLTAGGLPCKSLPADATIIEDDTVTVVQQTASPDPRPAARQHRKAEKAARKATRKTARTKSFRWQDFLGMCRTFGLDMAEAGCLWRGEYLDEIEACKGMSKSDAAEVLESLCGSPEEVEITPEEAKAVLDALEVDDTPTEEEAAPTEEAEAGRFVTEATHSPAQGELVEASPVPKGSDGRLDLDSLTSRRDKSVRAERRMHSEATSLSEAVKTNSANIAAMSGKLDTLIEALS